MIKLIKLTAAFRTHAKEVVPGVWEEKGKLVKSFKYAIKFLK